MRKPSVAARGVGFAVACASLAAASPAKAVEREHHVGVDLGVSALQVDDRGVRACCGLGGHYVYGLNDAFNLMAEATWSFVSFGEDSGATVPHTRPTMAGSASAGLAYVFDVLTYVPYAGVLVGPTVLAGGTLDHALVLPDVQAALGLDYKLSHSWAVGVAIREHFMVPRLSTYPVMSNVFARVEYSWGF